MDEPSLKVTVQGKYVEGKQQGYWQNDPFFIYESGVGSGHYNEDGLKQGTWTNRGSHCLRSYISWNKKGDYIDGKKEGTWLMYMPPDSWDDGSCEEKRYHQGKKVESKEVNMKICRQVEW